MIMATPLGSTGDYTSPWQIVFDFDAKKLYVEASSGEKFSVNDFLARGEAEEARIALMLLIVDWFPNTADDNNLADERPIVE